MARIEHLCWLARLAACTPEPTPRVPGLGGRRLTGTVRCEATGADHAGGAVGLPRHTQRHVREPSRLWSGRTHSADRRGLRPGGSIGDRRLRADGFLTPCSRYHRPALSDRAFRILVDRAIPAGYRIHSRSRRTWPRATSEGNSSAGELVYNRPLRSAAVGVDQLVDEHQELKIRSADQVGPSSRGGPDG